MAIRYGSPTGPITGVLCAVLQIVGIAALGELSTLFHIGVLKRPEQASIYILPSLLVALLYVVVGIVLGEAMEWRIRRAEFHQRQAEEMRRKVQASEIRRQEIESAYRVLEGRIAGQTSTVITLYESAQRLDALEPQEIYHGLADVLKKNLDVERCSIWEAGPDKVFRPVVPAEPGDRPLPPLGRAVLREGGVVTAREFFLEQEAAPGDGLLAGPLRATGDQITAVVVVEAMRFVGFTHTRVRLFELLLAWTSRSLANATNVADARRRDVYDAQLDLTSEAFLRARAEEEIALVRRRGASASVLVCRPAGEIPEETYQRLLVVLARTYRHLTRLSDSLAYFERERAFILFLPDVTLEGCATVRNKLEQNVAELDLRPYGPEQEALRLEWGMAELEDKEDFDRLLSRAFASLPRGTS